MIAAEEAVSTPTVAADPKSGSGEASVEAPDVRAGTTGDHIHSNCRANLTEA